MTFTPLPYANLSWQNNAPFSTHFDDIYFNLTQGIAESEYVFLQGNQLMDQWQTEKNRATPWIIGETGFGTGLNFFVISDAFLKHAAPHQKLQYISTEQSPIEPNELMKIYEQWPQFKPFTEILLNDHPPAIEGFYRLEFFEGRIQLDLLLGDAQKQLSQLATHYLSKTIAVDAWILDGFAPKKNPDMWSTTLFQTLAALSKPGTRFSTFTSAKIVKSGLTDAGFCFEKRKGFGKKRDCLAGFFLG